MYMYMVRIRAGCKSLNIKYDVISLHHTRYPSSYEPPGYPSPYPGASPSPFPSKLPITVVSVKSSSFTKPDSMIQSAPVQSEQLVQLVIKHLCLHVKSTINVCGYVVYAEGRKEEMSLGLNNSSYMSEHFIYFLHAMHSITEKSSQCIDLHTVFVHALQLILSEYTSSKMCNKCQK